MEMSGAQIILCLFASLVVFVILLAIGRDWGHMKKICVTVEVEDTCCKPHGRAPIRLVPKIGPFRELSGPVAPKSQVSGPTPSREFLMAAFKLKDTEKVDVAIEFVNAKGNVIPPDKVQLDGIPEWLSDNSDLVTITPAADGLSASIAATGALTAPDTPLTVTFSGDGDLGAGVKPILGTMEIEIEANPEAVAARLKPGVATPQ